MEKELDKIALAGARFAGDRLNAAPRQRTKPSPIPSKRLASAIDNSLHRHLAGQKRSSDRGQQRWIGHI
jgi:hypothetical protein